MTLTRDPRLYIGVMSKNVVDAALEYSRESGEPLGLIPSRRQVDFGGGYANNWTTEKLSEYVNGRLIIERDHGGPAQGASSDDGLQSFKVDASNFDIIHIDPWKAYRSVSEASEKTAEYMEVISKEDKTAFFEVGTEESIRPITALELDACLGDVKKRVSEDIFKNIKYAVVQSGVGLDLVNSKNTGVFSASRLENMIRVCNKYGIKSKEHNGDYLSKKQIKERFELGLDAINIAPEFGQIETSCYLEEMAEEIDEVYQICLDSGRWKKWVKDISDIKSKESLIHVCGHYILSSEEFLQIKPDIDERIKDKIKGRIEEIICAINE